MAVTAGYARQAASALSTLKRKGAPVTFTTHTAGAYDAATDTTSAPTDSTVAGYAVEVGSNPILYQSLSLVQGEAPTLLFCPTTYGQMPPLGAKVTWGGLDFTVRNVLTLAPDGTAITANIVVAR